ncbi:MAG: FAD-dependent oxidoreductase, partial [Nitriliruptorales bacterium]
GAWPARASSPTGVACAGLQSDRGVACAGLQSDRVAAMTGDRGGEGIVPFRGIYVRVRGGERIVPFRGIYVRVRGGEDLVRGNVYPVPDPRFPFLGVHLTRRLAGEVWAGPNALLALSRERYRGRRFSLRDTAATLGFAGFWRLARRHAGVGAVELWRQVRRRALLREIQAYVPDVGLEDLADGPNGVRAQTVRRDWTLVDDLSFGGSGRVLHVRNAPSPGATAALAIGSEIAARLFDRSSCVRHQFRGVELQTHRTPDAACNDEEPRFEARLPVLGVG